MILFRADASAAPQVLIATRRRLVGCITAVVSIVALLATTLFPTQAANAAPVSTVANASSVAQSNFLGVNAVYHGFSYMPESNSAGFADSLREVDFNRVSIHIQLTNAAPLVLKNAAEMVLYFTAERGCS